MVGLCEGGNEPAGSLKAICNVVHWVEAFKQGCIAVVNLLHIGHPVSPHTVCTSGHYRTMLNRKQALDFAGIIHTYGYFCADTVPHFKTGLADAQVVCNVGATSINGVAEMDSI
ncbi:hypothetical protein ANN_26326 [Periplaneta americana]|uniref:Per a allergen n=1 Tax=Periplaneta americana TaxID=6978 RepID=A0ABQ8S5Y3_PERAM|nr:hypothetical protein ANN_26326 [Periplaneta americana]